jgi:hypothetical protein
MPKMTSILEAISSSFFLITLSIYLGCYTIRTMVWRPRRLGDGGTTGKTCYQSSPLCLSSSVCILGIRGRRVHVEGVIAIGVELALAAARPRVRLLGEGRLSSSSS